MINTMLEFCIQHKLTTNQYVFLYCGYYQNFSLFNKYKEVNNDDTHKVIGNILIEDLIERDFLKKEGNKYEITEKFSNLFGDDYRLGEELYEVYPAYIKTDDGRTLPLKLSNRNEVRKMYFASIDGYLPEHREVIKDVKYAKQNNLIKGKIDMFVQSELWKDIRTMRLEAETSNVTSGNIADDLE